MITPDFPFPQFFLIKAVERYTDQFTFQIDKAKHVCFNMFAALILHGRLCNSSLWFLDLFSDHLAPILTHNCIHYFSMEAKE
jgi:hypothetical protein